MALLAATSVPNSSVVEHLTGTWKVMGSTTVVRIFFQFIRLKNVSLFLFFIYASWHSLQIYTFVTLIVDMLSLAVLVGG